MTPASDSGSNRQNPAPGEADATGAIYWPGDDEPQRAPGSALLLLILSFVAGGLYLWSFWPLMAGFDWIAALTLRSSVLAVAGGAIMILGGVLLIRHGMVWASRFGSIVAALPMGRLLIDSVADTGGANLGSASLAFLLSGGPALLIFLLTFSPALTRWRRRRRQVVATQQPGRPST
jgi:hypothetical protein